MKRAVLITGLVRDPRNFMTILDELESARVKHGDFTIIYSTWLGEVDTYPELTKKLNMLGATVLEQEAPNLKISGHMLHQVINLEMGLCLLPEDCFVLKIRPDLSKVTEINNFFNLCDNELRGGQQNSDERHKIFSCKVFVQYFHASEAFYINDITFAGMKRDLVRLCTIPLVSLVKFTRIAPEQLLWSTPFFHQGWLFERIWRSNVGLVFHDTDQVAKLRSVLRDSTVFIDALAESFCITAANFRFLKSGDYLEDEVEALSQWRLEELFWSPIDCRGLVHSFATNSNTFRTTPCMEVVMSTRYAASNFGDRFRSALNSCMKGRQRSEQEIMSLEREVEALGYRIESEVGVGGMRYLREALAGKLLVRGLPPAWTLIEGGSSREMDPEVNLLRRTIDDLNKEVARLRIGRDLTLE